MDIPQPSLALLDVRFQQINRTAVAGMACVVFGELFADKPVDPFSGQAALDGFLKFVVEGLVAADVSAIEKRSPDFHIRAGQAHRLTDATNGMTHLKPGIP